MDITYCGHSGLVFVNELAMTVERIKMVVDVMIYAKENDGQFDHTITVKDVYNTGEFTFTKDNFPEFQKGLLKFKDCRIASDIDFN